MINMIDLNIANAVAYRIAGKITQAEMKDIFERLKEKIAQYGNVVIYQEIDSLDGVELAALMEKFKALSEIGLSNISKIAVVSDKQWLLKTVVIEDYLFKKIAMQSFEFKDKQQAIEFLRES